MFKFYLYLSYLNSTAIFAFIIPSFLVIFKNYNLNLNDLNSVITLFGSSLQNWYKVQGVSE